MRTSFRRRRDPISRAFLYVDNVEADAGTGGAVFATDDIGSVHYPITKITYGALDSQTIAASGAGAVSAGVPRFTLASDDPAVTSLQLLDNTVYVDDADWTALTSSHQLVGGVYASVERVITDGDTAPISLDVNGHIITSVHADTIALGDDVSNTANIVVDEAGAFVVQATMSYCFDGTTWDRTRGDATNGLLVNLGANNDVTVSAAGTGGMSYSLLPMAAEDNDTVIKASAGTIYFISVQSLDATPVYLKLFDAASITPGTTDCDIQYMCPANATAALGAGIVLNFSPGIEFATGIVALVATGIAKDDNTAVAANEVVVTIGWE